MTTAMHIVFVNVRTHTHTYTHAHTPRLTHARTHAPTHERTHPRPRTHLHTTHQKAYCFFPTKSCNFSYSPCIDLSTTPNTHKHTHEPKHNTQHLLFLSNTPARSRSCGL